ncbi:MAG: FHA domain-containing protein [Planctomycetes bacterium]|nr:FHA domain-containing protein [Planctomycetota bacterium]
MIRLRLTVNGKVEREFDLDRELLIGRKAPADIVVADGQISSKHAKVRPDGLELVVTDLGSTNGTRIDDGDRLAPHADVPLRRGQKLVFGPAILEITATGGTESDSGFGRTEKTVAVGAGTMQSLLVEIARFKAAHGRLVLGAEHAHQTIEITEMEVIVGREKGDAQIVVPHQSVSSKHAKIKFDGGRFLIEDLGSANGTFLGGVRISAATPLEPQTAVTFGTVDCLFVARSPEAGGAAGASDPLAEVLANHAVRMGKATDQQAREALTEHRTSGRTLGEIFVEKGIFSPKDWAELYRQRQVIATLQPTTAAGGGGGTSKLIGIVVVVVGLVVLALVGWKAGWFGGAPK